MSVERTQKLHVSADGRWWVQDLNSSNGVYLADHRVERAPITERMVIRLGISGPEVTLEIVNSQKNATQPLSNQEKTSQYIQHYFGAGASDDGAGEHTMYVRKAYAQVHAKQKRRFGNILGILAIILLGLGAYAFNEHRQVRRQTALARELFYQMKSIDIDIGVLQQTITSDNKQGSEALQKFKNRREDMETNYDRFLATLHVYAPKMTEQDRLILRVARIFGECELDMPPQFSQEVYRYISNIGKPLPDWRKPSPPRRRKVTWSSISREMLAEGLPPQFFYLALQESDFDPYASGPNTRMGIAKGMWQFIPSQAVKYGLRLGPLVDLRRPDPRDDRHHYDRETIAAGKYLKDLFDTDAQASGLL